MARGEGIEPPLTDSKSAVLPLDDPRTRGNYRDSSRWRQGEARVPTCERSRARYHVLTTSNITSMKKLLIGSMVGGLLLTSCAPAPTNTPPTEEADSMMESTTSMENETSMISELEKTRQGTMVAYHEDESGTYEGYFVDPGLEEDGPALILIHEWWGLNDNIKDFADNFAKQGYRVLAVDMYGKEAASTPDMAREYATAVREDTASAAANLTAAVDFLKAQEGVIPELIGSVGWCFGGQWAYEMAKNDMGVAATIMYYGRFNTEDDLSMMKAQLQGHFGEEDMSIAVDDVREFQAKLMNEEGDHEIFIYPNAGHAFANEDNEEAYNEEAAEEAWERTMEFLREHLSEE